MTPRMASPTSAGGAACSEVDLLRLAGREQPTAEQAYAVGKTPFLIGYVAYCVRVGRWADARRDAEQLRAALAEAAG